MKNKNNKPGDISPVPFPPSERKTSGRTLHMPETNDAGLWQCIGVPWVLLWELDKLQTGINPPWRDAVYCSRRVHGILGIVPLIKSMRDLLPARSYGRGFICFPFGFYWSWGSEGINFSDGLLFSNVTDVYLFFAFEEGNFLSHRIDASSKI